MKKLQMRQMEGLQGGRCRWWQILAGFALFATAPVTFGVGAVLGTVVGVTACDGW